MNQQRVSNSNWPRLAWLVMLVSLPGSAFADAVGYFRVEDAGKVIQYDTFAQFTTNAFTNTYNGGLTYGDDAGFFFDYSRNSYIRVNNSGDVLEYLTFNDFTNNVASNAVNHGTVGVYGNDADFFYDFSRDSYFRVAQGSGEDGAIVEYGTFSDFISNSNPTLHNTIAAYADDAGFFFDPGRNSYFRIEGTSGSIYEFSSLSDFTSNSNSTLQGTVSTYGNDRGFFSITAVPEPSSSLLLATGAGCLAVWRRRKQR